MKERQAMPTEDVLGPLPEPDMSHEKAKDDVDVEFSYSPEALERERRRCYELGVRLQTLVKAHSCAGLMSTR